MKPVLACVAVLLLAGCSSMPFGKFTAHGSLSESGQCGTGDSAHSEGTKVTVTDAEGTTIAIGGFDPGKYDAQTDTCTFTFSVPNTPVHDIYGVAVSDQSASQFTLAQMRAGLSLKGRPASSNYWGF